MASSCTFCSSVASVSGRLTRHVDPSGARITLPSHKLSVSKIRVHGCRPKQRNEVSTRALSNIFTEAWGTNNSEELQTLSQTVSSQLFAFSIFPYAAFLYYLTKSRATPRLMLFGWYFLLAFVGATIPAGIYAKVHYGTTLANVDWLHGGAELFLTMTNLFIGLGCSRVFTAFLHKRCCTEYHADLILMPNSVLGTRQAIRDAEQEQEQQQQQQQQEHAAQNTTSRRSSDV